MTDRYSDDTTDGRGEATFPNFAPMTLEEEALAGGWTRITAPTGPDAPDRAPVVGTRGDPDLDSDQHYGPGERSTVSDEG